MSSKLAGVAHPQTFEGRKVAAIQGKSITPILKNSGEAVRGPGDWTGWQLFGNRALREGDWKLLWLCKPFGAAQWELFNLKDDPGETRDLASERPEIRNRLVSRWDEYVKTNNVIFPSVSPLCGQNYSGAQ